jgi:hypothetical protein
VDWQLPGFTDGMDERTRDEARAFARELEGGATPLASAAFVFGSSLLVLFRWSAAGVRAVARQFRAKAASAASGVRTPASGRLVSARMDIPDEGR